MPQMDNFSQQVQGGAGSRPQHELPLLMRMGGMNPFQFKGRHMVAINANRFANTMFEGGFLDVSAGATGKRAAAKGFLGRRTGAYSGSTMLDNSQYATGRIFRQNMPSWTGKMGKKFEEGGRKFKAQAANSFPFRRFDSVARLAGDAADNTTYTPFQFTSFLTERGFANKGGLGKALRGRFKNDFDPTTGELLPGKTLYSGGVFGRISTMGKTIEYEKQVAAYRALGPRNPASLSRAEARTWKKGLKASEKLEKLDENLVRLGKQTEANFARAAATEHLTASSISTFGVPIHLTDDMITGTIQSGAVDAQIGAQIENVGRLRAVSETSKGVVSRRITDYFGTMMGGGAQFEGTQAFTNVANTFGKAMEGSRFGGVGAAALDDTAHAAKSAFSIATRNTGYTDEALNLLRSGDVAAIRSTAGKLGMEALGRKEYGTAAKMLGHYAGTYGKAAGTALSVYGNASLVYDVGKGIGKMIMGGVNIGKEALKSMQGSLNKPLFGAGFKDNEVAATSRSRGVMAIQNSRLNARSLLGSEGSMMAAHFG